MHAGAELYGADKILNVLVKGLVRCNWNVTVVLPWAGELKPVLEECGASVVVVNHGVLRRKYFTPCGLLNRARRIVLAGLALARIIKSRRIDIVHTNTSVVMAGALAAALARVPHVWHIHEITTRPKLIWKGLSWLIPRGASRVVCVSEAVLSHLRAGDQLNGRKGTVIHNGIDPLAATIEARCSIRRELAVADTDVLVGMVGRVNSWKGQMVFAEAAAKVAAINPNVRFLFVGGTFSGEEMLLDALRNRAAAADLRGKATVWDFRKDVANIMAALDIFALPSTQPDPLPTVVLEAMSLARPIVAFAHGGVCEMVAQEETGILVPPCDSDALAEAILRLAADNALRTKLGSRGQIRFQEHFSVQAFISAWQKAYDETIS